MNGPSRAGVGWHNHGQLRKLDTSRKPLVGLNKEGTQSVDHDTPRIFLFFMDF